MHHEIERVEYRGRRPILPQPGGYLMIASELQFGMCRIYSWLMFRLDAAATILVPEE